MQYSTVQSIQSVHTCNYMIPWWMKFVLMRSDLILRCLLNVCVHDDGRWPMMMMMFVLLLQSTLNYLFSFGLHYYTLTAYFVWCLIFFFRVDGWKLKRSKLEKRYLTFFVDEENYIQFQSRRIQNLLLLKILNKKKEFFHPNKHARTRTRAHALQLVD